MRAGRGERGPGDPGLRGAGRPRGGGGLRAILTPAGEPVGGGTARGSARRAGSRAAVRTGPSGTGVVRSCAQSRPFRPLPAGFGLPLPPERGWRVGGMGEGGRVGLGSCRRRVVGDGSGFLQADYRPPPAPGPRRPESAVTPSAVRATARHPSTPDGVLLRASLPLPTCHHSCPRLKKLRVPKPDRAWRRSHTWKAGPSEGLLGCGLVSDWVQGNVATKAEVCMGSLFLDLRQGLSFTKERLSNLALGQQRFAGGPQEIGCPGPHRQLPFAAPTLPVCWVLSWAL